MTKVVFNTCYGGFGLSYKAVMRYAELKGIKVYGFTWPIEGGLDAKMIPVNPKTADKEFLVHYRTSSDPEEDGNYFSVSDIDRSDPVLIQVVEEMGPKAGGKFSSLEITDIPAGTLYRIDEYDGRESVMKQSDYDWSKA